MCQVSKNKDKAPWEFRKRDHYLQVGEFKMTSKKYRCLILTPKDSNLMSLGVQPRLQDLKTFSQVIVIRAAKVENHSPRGTSIWKCSPGSLQGGGAAEMSPRGG